MEEIWKDVVGYEGIYQVSNVGRLKRLFDKRYTRGDGGKVRKSMFLTGSKDEDGYYRVCFNVDNHKTYFSVSALVAAAFIGDRPEGFLVCHNNGKRDDNRVENLRYDTPQGNADDMEKHNTKLNGEKNHNSKLTSEQVLLIRKYAEEYKYTDSELSKMFGVLKNVINKITNNTAWRHLPHCNKEKRIYRRLYNSEYVELMKILDSKLYKISDIARVYGLPVGTLYSINRTRTRGLQYV